MINGLILTQKLRHVIEEMINEKINDKIIAIIQSIENYKI